LALADVALEDQDRPCLRGSGPGRGKRAVEDENRDGHPPETNPMRASSSVGETVCSGPAKRWFTASRAPAKCGRSAGKVAPSCLRSVWQVAGPAMSSSTLSRERAAASGPKSRTRTFMVKSILTERRASAGAERSTHEHPRPIRGDEEGAPGPGQRLRG